MAIVSLDEHTVDELQAQAAASGMTVDAYVKILLRGAAAVSVPRLSWNEVEVLLDQQAIDGPTLPPDFSRRHL